MNEFITLLNDTSLYVILVAIFLSFLVRLLDYVIKVLYNNVLNKPHEIKTERIRNYLYEVLQLTIEQIISGCSYCIRAYVIQHYCDKDEFLASEHHPMYSNPKLFVDGLEEFLTTGEVNAVFKSYGVEDLWVKKLVLKRTYYVVIEFKQKVAILDATKSQLTILEFMLKLLDDFTTILGDCDETRIQMSN